MPNYRRAQDGNTYFFTVVTYQRQPILSQDPFRKAFGETVREIRNLYPFKIKAWVLLPDHLHCIWELPEGDTNYSMRWGLIKKELTKKANALSEMVGIAHPTSSRERHRESTIWQRRFWEHRIRDDRDLVAHCDYIHYNPVKHGLVKSPCDWEYSTFRGYVKEGIYPMEWRMSEIDFPKDIGGE